VLDNVLHGIAEPARSVHGDEDERGVAVLGVGDAFVDVGGEDGLDFAVDFQFEDDGAGGMFIRGGGGEEGKQGEAGESYKDESSESKKDASYILRG
jgi:hypothetical protein